jgi:hypothetical protein
MPLSIKTLKIFDDITISGSGYVESDDLNLQGAEGYLSMQVEVTNSGIVDLSYYVSLDGNTFVRPTEGNPITTDLTESSGYGSDGKHVFTIDEVVLAPWIKIRATESGGTNPVNLTAYLGLQ